MRILIATATAGGGHLAAAAALEETWRQLRPKDFVKQVDLVQFFSPLHRKIHAEGYVTLVDHAPELWGLMFKRTDNLALAKRLNRFKQVFPSHSRARFARCVKELRPEAVLCTHYLPLEILAQLKRRTLRAQRRELKPLAEDLAQPPLVVSVVTDFEAHALWMDGCVDLYCVAAEQTKARLVARGAEPAQVLATGIPISTRFSQKIPVMAVRRRLGLRDDQPILLVLSGGFGMGPVVEIVRQLDKLDQPFQVIVVSGRNQELRRDLAANDYAHPTHVLGFASNMEELMAISDLVISKPGGLTSSEALALGKPLLILNPIPGQEAANSDFLLEHGAAAKANRTEDLPYRLQELLASKKLAAMAKAAKALGKPGAAAEICQATAARLEQRQTLSQSVP